MNINIMKCYYLLLNGGLIYNLGSYITLAIILIDIILSIIFCKEGYKWLYKKIYELIENKFEILKNKDNIKIKNDLKKKKSRINIKKKTFKKNKKYNLINKKKRK